MPNHFYSTPAPDTSLFAEAALGMLREEQQAKRACSISLVPPRIAPSLLSGPAPTYPSITVFPATPDTIAARNQHLLFHSIRHLDEPHQHRRDVAKSAHRGKKALKQLAPLPGNKQTEQVNSMVSSPPYDEQAFPTDVPNPFPPDYVSPVFSAGRSFDSERSNLWRCLVYEYGHKFNKIQLLHDFNLLWWYRWDHPRYFAYRGSRTTGNSWEASLVIPGHFKVVEGINPWPIWPTDATILQQRQAEDAHRYRNSRLQIIDANQNGS